MIKLKSVLPHLLAIIIAIVIVVKLFPVAHPGGGILLPLDSRIIENRAKTILDSLKIDATYLSPGTTFQADKKLVRQIQPATAPVPSRSGDHWTAPPSACAWTPPAAPGPARSQLHQRSCCPAPPWSCQARV